MKLRRVQPEEAAAPAPRPRAGPPRPPPGPPEALPHTAARFRGAADLLAFLGAVAGQSLADEVHCWSGPDDRFWAEIPAPPQPTALLALAVGGRPFGGRAPCWVSLRPDLSGDGPLPSATGGRRTLRLDDRVEVLDPERWRELDLPGLLGALPLPGRAGPLELDEALVLAPGPLSRMILGQLHRFGVRTTLRTATLRPLAEAGPERAVAALELRGAPTLPAALLGALADLPEVLALRPASAADQGGGVLIDLRSDVPAALALLAGLVPEGERWALGTAGAGRWRLRLAPQAHESDLLISAARALPPGRPAPPRPLSLPEPRPLQLSPRPGDRAPVDARLLDVAELGWTATLLRKLAVDADLDATALAVGDERALLVGPERLLAALPFGLALSHAGGRLLRPVGESLDPPLSPDAIRARLGPGPDEVLALHRRDGALRLDRFDTRRLLPVWSLWVGPGPSRAPSAAGREELRRLSALVGQLPRVEAPKPWLRRMAETVGLSADERDATRDEARRLEIQGRWVEAGERWERAGEHAAAGRAFERAAQGG